MTSLPHEHPVVMGIDPGLTRCGVGVVRRRGPFPGAELLDVGCLRSESSWSTPQRLVALDEQLALMLKRHRPAVVAIEQVFMQRNTSNAVGTAQVMGVVSVAAAKAGATVVTYTPTEVKASVTGHGGADKAQVGAMVARVLKLEAPPKPVDAADAVAVALTHVWRDVAASRLASAGGGQTQAQQVWASARATTRTVSWEERLARSTRRGGAR